MKHILAILFTLFATVALAQPCATCPPSLTAPGAAAAPTSGFNGFTSEVDQYDGIAPTCYLPSANTLNGHLQGINQQLCELQLLIDSLGLDNDTVQLALAQIEEDIDELYAIIGAIDIYGLQSADNSITVIDSSSDFGSFWDIAANMQFIADSLMGLVNPDCLGVGDDWESVMQYMINAICSLTTPSADTCLDWDLFFTASISSGVSSLGVSATVLSDGPTPEDMCLSAVTYTFFVYDSLGFLLPNGNGIINASTDIGSNVVFVIPVTYAQGARSVVVNGKFYKEKCESGVYCQYSDSTLTFIVAAPSVTEMVANDDFPDTLVQGICAAFNVLANDIRPYPITQLNIVTNPNDGTVGTVSLVNGTITYCPDSDYDGADSLQYEIVDVIGQRDSAWVHYNVRECADSSVLTRIDSAEMVVNTANNFTFTVYWNNFDFSRSNLTWQVTMAYNKDCSSTIVNQRDAIVTGNGRGIDAIFGGPVLSASGNLEDGINLNFGGAINGCSGTEDLTWVLLLTYTDDCGVIQNASLTFP